MVNFDEILCFIAHICRTSDNYREASVTAC